MESKIISEEVLNLHMVEESEKLLSEMKNGEVGRDMFLVRVLVRIYRYERDKDWGKKELIYENKGFVVNRFTRWKWFFRYLQATEQVKTPKQLVQINWVSYVDPNREKVLLKVLGNKLIAAKRDRTKAQLKIENGKMISESTSLFSVDEDPDYLKALEYLSKKQQLISEIEAEISQLSNMIQSNESAL